MAITYNKPRVSLYAVTMGNTQVEYRDQSIPWGHQTWNQMGDAYMYGLNNIDSKMTYVPYHATTFAQIIKTTEQGEREDPVCGTTVEEENENGGVH